MADSSLSPKLIDELTDIAKELGFVGVGISSVAPLTRGSEALERWISESYHGDMAYMAKHPRRDDPSMMLEGTKSMLVVALPYARDTSLPLVSEQESPRGIIARYAQGRDYHEVLREKLTTLAERLTELLGCPVLSRPCVDTAPMLEREYALRAGLGFIAKNTMLIMPHAGSYVLLGELLLDIELPTSTPIKPKCGQCTQCLDACPTDAFVSPYVLDARKCISYFTIELADAIPTEFRSKIGNRVFGCDICQEVCPFNGSPKPRPGDAALAPKPELSSPKLVELLEITSNGYKRLVKNTAMRRISRPQIMRNAAVALGNTKSRHVVAPLAKALTDNNYPLVRGHIAWALGQISAPESHHALKSALGSEKDPWVLSEIESALQIQEPNHG